MAIAVQCMFLLSIRSAIRSSASSMSEPIRVSAMARENSLAAGWATSRDTASRACGRENPVDRLLATSVSTSGSCRSNLRARRLGEVAQHQRWRDQAEDDAEQRSEEDQQAVAVDEQDAQQHADDDAR